MGQGLCCCKCEALFGKKSDRNLQDEYRGVYRPVERYRDEPIEKYTDEEPAGIVDDSMLSEGRRKEEVIGSVFKVVDIINRYIPSTGNLP